MNQFIEQIFDRHRFPLLNTDCLRSLTLDSMSTFTLYSLLRGSFMLSELKHFTIRFQTDQCKEKLHDLSRRLLATFPRHFPSLQALDISGDGALCIDDSIVGVPHPSLVPTHDCFSLRHLSIDNFVITNTPNLLARYRNLYKICANVRLNHPITAYQVLPHLSVCQLVLIESSFQSLVNLLKQCSNLKRLIVNLIPVDDDGRSSDQWKHLIKAYLPKLKHLDISMRSYDVSSDELEGTFLYHFSLDHFWLDRRTKVTVLEKEATLGEASRIEIMISFSVGKSLVDVEEKNLQ